MQIFFSRILLSTSILFCVHFTSIFAQTPSSELPNLVDYDKEVEEQEIIDYLRMLDDFFDLTLQKQKIDSGIVQRIFEAGYKIHYKYPVELKRYIKMEYDILNKILREDSNFVYTNYHRIPVRQGQFTRYLAKHFEPWIQGIFSINYYVKGTVLQIEDRKDSTNEFIKFRKFVKIKINRVLKGSENLLGNTLEFYYIAGWMNDPINNRFKENWTFLIPLAYHLNNGNPLISLVTYPDRQDGVIKYDAGKIYDPDNYFGLGKRINDDEFANKIENVLQNVNKYRLEEKGDSQ